MKIYSSIDDLIEYLLVNNLISERDKNWAINSLLEKLKLESYQPGNRTNSKTISQILESLLDFAVNKNLIGDSITEKDLFDTQIMGMFVPKPSEVDRIFWEKYKNSPKEATDWFYNQAIVSNYIRKDRIDKNEKWNVNTEYGPLEITINLSKPEKDPKAIAAAKNKKQSGYPKCALCAENEGYAGRLDHPARQNHRLIPITLNHEAWSLQFSPFLYYDQHLIALNNKHVPMVIDRAAFEKMFDFLDLFPHYFIGSNADLPIVGGSILSHEHFQGGLQKLPMVDAPIRETFRFKEYPNVRAGILNWPLSVIRLNARDRQEILDLSEKILNCWRAYSDENVNIISHTDGEAHNTITPIARMNGDYYEIDLVLRNNRTTDKKPLGIFHPRDEYHHIKKENIGLIEVMGLAILPARLKEEMQLAREVLTGKAKLEDFPELNKHYDWIVEIERKYSNIDSSNVDKILRDEIGYVFKKVLEDAGVFKNNKKGQEAFKKFLVSVDTFG